VKVEVGAATEYSLSVNDRRGASTPYRGVYDSNKTYYGTSRRTDVVKYNDNYYVARADVGTFTNKVPTNTDYWNDYGAQFESVATQLLLAEYANIAGFIFKDNKLISQKGTINGQESNNYGANNFIPNLLLDGVNGSGVFRGIVHSSMMYTGVKVITTTPYYIDPNTEAYNWFFINENTQRFWVYLPNSSAFDGLEINILNKQSNWWFEHTDLCVAVQNGDTLCGKSNVAVIDGVPVENCGETFWTEAGRADMLCQPNQHCVFKAINGAWYVIKGVFTGE
jgi:hypothetical protein